MSDEEFEDSELELDDEEIAEIEKVENMGDEGRAEHDRVMEEEDTEFGGSWEETIEGEERFEEVELSDEAVDDIVNKILSDDEPEPPMPEQYFKKPMLGYSEADAEKMVVYGLGFIKELASTVPVLNQLNIAKKFGTLHTVFASGKAFSDVFRSGISDVDQLKAKLDEVIKKLQEMEQTFQSKMNELIAQLDIGEFRTEVMIPTQIIFDRMLHFFNTLSNYAKDDFIAGCQANSEFKPTNILSKIKVYVGPFKDIFAKQLQDGEYSYDTFKEWADHIYLLSVRLAICHIFYYGLIAQDEEAAKESMTAETNEMIRRFGEFVTGLERINVERMKNYHKEGFAAKKLKEVFLEKVEQNWRWGEDFGAGLLPNAAKKLAAEWKDVNGPCTFYVAVVRGLCDSTNTRSTTKFYVSDEEKVTVVKDVASEGHDAVSLVLIQPVTPEMIQAHSDKVNGDTKDKVIEILTVTGPKRFASYWFNQFQSRLEGLDEEKKPLLMVYNCTGHGPLANGYKAPEVIPYAYRVLAQASTEASKDFRAQMFSQFIKFTITRPMAHTVRCRYVLSIFYQ